MIQVNTKQVSFTPQHQMPQATEAIWQIKSITRVLQGQKYTECVQCHFQSKVQQFKREAKAHNVYLYPHSLSYHDTTFTNFLLKAIPALASKMLDLHQKLYLQAIQELMYTLLSNLTSILPAVTDKVCGNHIIFSVSQDTLQLTL